MRKEHITLHADPADAEDFDVTVEAMDRGQRARLIRKTRTALGLSQSDFASRFRVPVGTLRDWEQGRVAPDQAARAYLTVIARDPEAVRKARARIPAWRGPDTEISLTYEANRDRGFIFIESRNLAPRFQDRISDTAE